MNTNVVNPGLQMNTSVVLFPTRELSTQVYQEMLTFYHKTGFRLVNVYGGKRNRKEQCKQLAFGCDILLGIHIFNLEWNSCALLTLVS